MCQFQVGYRSSIHVWQDGLMVLSTLRVRTILGSNPTEGASFNEKAVLVKFKYKTPNLVKNNFSGTVWPVGLVV